MKNVQMPHPKILPIFATKKKKILAALATPPNFYTDLSPKGSVDSGIKDLLDRINQIDGAVTTSSCAGRISVFLEGSKDARNCEAVGEGEERSGDGQAAVPAGKGRGGRWLFVSHDPLDVRVGTPVEAAFLITLFGLSRKPCVFPKVDTSQVRFVRFQFEPMILHIMTASLHHAQAILSAAINAGFCESGVQSLKNLEDPNAFPMVAVRTSGLALGSVIGWMHDGEDEKGEVHSLVGEDHLELLVRIANERFVANAERIQRFSDYLFRSEKEGGSAWEDKLVRQDRKRAEGLKQQQMLQGRKVDE